VRDLGFAPLYFLKPSQLFTESILLLIKNPNLELNHDLTGL
jgi:hypothetical protein